MFGIIKIKQRKLSDTHLARQDASLSGHYDSRFATNPVDCIALFVDYDIQSIC
jgi:hypothetical protein